MSKLTAPLLIATMALASCGGGGSGWNPLSWGSPPARTLEPEGGYSQVSDNRPDIPQITSARWEPLNEGRLLVVNGFAPVRGYSSVALVTARPMPGDRISPDADGVLRLRLVGVPPAPGNAAVLPARPGVDEITAAMSLSLVQLARITAVEITSASNVVTLRR
ncbi:hypothetical protein [Paracoccus benzoatiresistens]|uniref:Uncharacterized protein n=1 Tax=Paracoccus benzoatiresistens TaxID=2997341 RepID=A0ABT4J6D2_9RHOB|nr:hypothetical protein [Paracoccus sp. EF6]MCZ0962680.1 hypothetical protein [Paracoccus sp. EF6]